MSPAAIGECRAHLFVASLSAMLIQLVLLPSLIFLGARETLFTTLTFRLAIGAIVVAALFGVRALSRSAFRSAVASRHVRYRSPTRQIAFISPACPRRALVILHVRLNRRKFLPPSHLPCCQSARSAFH